MNCIEHFHHLFVFSSIEDASTRKQLFVYIYMCIYQQNTIVFTEYKYEYSLLAFVFLTLLSAIKFDVGCACVGQFFTHASFRIANS